eukprot:CAMPEP_0174258356 /NCGR_PEP_ID=MMETSP0439-20130205/7358_1 /TAXON_ID=0 /ORGANISM="Stereomyxa ramosa, Strain Chinc5" /LENGTH=922 /DNA_ID=CAMNT_0015341827 /DNA_START=180 /DNA_END=2945 /DNA_ORIENTATION=+
MSLSSSPSFLPPSRQRRSSSFSEHDSKPLPHPSSHYRRSSFDLNPHNHGLDFISASDVVVSKKVSRKKKIFRNTSAEPSFRHKFQKKVTSFKKDGLILPNETGGRSNNNRERENESEERDDQCTEIEVGTLNPKKKHTFIYKKRFYEELEANDPSYLLFSNFTDTEDEGEGEKRKRGKEESKTTSTSLLSLSPHSSSLSFPNFPPPLSNSPNLPSKRPKFVYRERFMQELVEESPDDSNICHFSGEEFKSKTVDSTTQLHKTPPSNPDTTGEGTKSRHRFKYREKQRAEEQSKNTKLAFSKLWLILEYNLRGSKHSEKSMMMLYELCYELLPITLFSSHFSCITPFISPSFEAYRLRRSSISFPILPTASKTSLLKEVEKQSLKRSRKKGSVYGTMKKQDVQEYKELKRQNSLPSGLELSSSISTLSVQLDPDTSDDFDTDTTEKYNKNKCDDKDKKKKHSSKGKKRKKEKSKQAEGEEKSKTKKKRKSGKNYKKRMDGDNLQTYSSSDMSKVFCALTNDQLTKLMECFASVKQAVSTILEEMHPTELLGYIFESFVCLHIIDSTNYNHLLENEENTLSFQLIAKYQNMSFSDTLAMVELPDYLLQRFLEFTSKKNKNYKWVEQRDKTGFFRTTSGKCGEVKISELESEESSEQQNLCYKGVADLDISPQKIYDFLTVESMSTWNPIVEHATIEETFGDCEALILRLYFWTFNSPKSKPRDGVVVFTKQQYKGKYVLLWSSVNSPNQPDNNLYLRTWTYLAGLIIDPIQSNQSRITAVSMMELKTGVMEENRECNILQASTPLFVMNHLTQLAKLSAKITSSFQFLPYKAVAVIDKLNSCANNSGEHNNENYTKIRNVTTNEDEKNKSSGKGKIKNFLINNRDNFSMDNLPTDSSPTLTYLDHNKGDTIYIIGTAPKKEDIW